MPKLHQLANDPVAYGYDHTALRWLVVSEDGRTEFAGPMRESDARAFLGLLEAVVQISNWPHEINCLALSHKDSACNCHVNIARTAYRTAMKERGQ